MVAKFIVHGSDREHARKRLLRCLDEYVVHGIENNIEFLKKCLVVPEFVEGHYDTGMIGRMPDLGEDATPEALDIAAAALFAALTAAPAAAPSAGESGAGSRWATHSRLRGVGRL
jgi:acetyl/propionyl-CoA carboxylase alpha subunit